MIMNGSLRTPETRCAFVARIILLSVGLLCTACPFFLDEVVGLVDLFHLLREIGQRIVYVVVRVVLRARSSALDFLVRCCARDAEYLIRIHMSFPLLRFVYAAVLAQCVRHAGSPRYKTFSTMPVKSPKGALHRSDR